MRIHFIAIGGAAMHNLAMAVATKAGYIVTGMMRYSTLHGLILRKQDYCPKRWVGIQRISHLILML